MSEMSRAAQWKVRQAEIKKAEREELCLMIMRTVVRAYSWGVSLEKLAVEVQPVAHTCGSVPNMLAKMGRKYDPARTRELSGVVEYQVLGPVTSAVADYTMWRDHFKGRMVVEKSLFMGQRREATTTSTTYKEDN